MMKKLLFLLLFLPSLALNGQHVINLDKSAIGEIVTILDSVQNWIWVSKDNELGVENGTMLFPYNTIAEGLADVFPTLREQDPDIALEPTCLGYYPSPWWLMHTPFVIGPFGDDSPRGRCPSPEWIESMTTARDIANLSGRDAFWMPSSALECFDIIVQCPGEFYNHAVMAIARGHWFLSTYINPRFMDADEWRFFADLVRWARANRDLLQNPVVFGGDPGQREAYGYAYLSPERQLYFARNPWMEAADIRLPEPPSPAARELRALYPRREVLCRAKAESVLPPVRLGPYESAVLEVVPSGKDHRAPEPPPGVEVAWHAEAGPAFERVIYEGDRPAYGPSWTSPNGDADEMLTYMASGKLNTETASELCLLVEGPPGGAPPVCSVTVDGEPLALRETGSRGAFYAAQADPDEDWQWFLAAVPAGEHSLSLQVNGQQEDVRCGLFLRGSRPVAHRSKPFEPGPSFPVHRPHRRKWAKTLAPLASLEELGLTERRASREITTINGVFLDALEWIEATAGWGEVHRNTSVMGKPMTMGGKVFHRGLGTHAHSRITYDVPAGYASFAATIGCDQEVVANSVVFVVEADGRELFRSPLMRSDTPPLDIDLPIRGASRLALIVEDGGDGIPADHGNWADARLLR